MDEARIKRLRWRTRRGTRELDALFGGWLDERFAGADEATRQKAWASFGADPEWTAVKAASETKGPLLKSQQVSVLSPAVAGLLLG